MLLSAWIFLEYDTWRAIESKTQDYSRYLQIRWNPSSETWSCADQHPLGTDNQI